MNHFLKEDLTNLEGLLEKIKEQGISYLDNLSERATYSDHQLPEEILSVKEGKGSEETFKIFNERLEPLMVASSGPRYWGFVTGGTTPASIMGDWLTSIYDQNTQALKGVGDISGQIEIETIKMLLDFFELPQDYIGGFVSGATMSNFTCLAVARQWIGKNLGKDFAKDGITEKINVLSAMPHSSSIKSLSMLGIGSNNITKIKVAEGNRECLDTVDLEEKIKELNGEPFILISSAGTVNTVDFDDFQAISKLKNKYNFWWHIDAAFGAFAKCSDEHKHLLKDWENADSITIDNHKWMNVPYENAVFLIKEKHKLEQIETFQNSSAPYLGDPMEKFSCLNFLPENSRRLKALPVWFSMIAYGKDGFKEMIEKSISLSQYFGKLIENDNNFEILAPVRLNTVCFTLKDQTSEQVLEFLERLNQTKKVFLTPTIYKGKQAIRAALVNWRTESSDVELVFNLMQELLRK
ncbi:pyridoxal phosphate-dependent decarboxylase family protein [Epilithonimonas lactis]|uniref:Amino acid decarboxylase n=1 Tax=Epilithonimonas lactis TaxID=421072 RepID=A0A085BJR5_9FLAO|nr:pyridoxal-dependent decarboxylase [Epilithonimonas lactis]KFC22710.1 amino acid decarboxylase [Epilithonimonas lactis]SEQ85156.1 Glutamate or tyrosine decarboxylase [Epilithonimonas lactis]